MARRLRHVAEGVPHHVTQRGNYKQKVFHIQRDFRNYCYWAQEFAEKYEIEILSYCLMRNHVHFILIPPSKENLAKFMSVLHMKYSQYMHWKRKRVGHLWQGRYYSSVIEKESYFVEAIRYVERNPVRAGISDKAWNYVWSSAAWHVGLQRNPIIKATARKRLAELVSGTVNWADYLTQSNEAIENLIRESTYKGSGIGSQS